MGDIELVLNDFDPATREKIVQALGILVESELLIHLIRQNKNHLVDHRMDSEDLDAISREVREARQTNRVLLGFNESARRVTEKVS